MRVSVRFTFTRPHMLPPGSPRRRGRERLSPAPCPSSHRPCGCTRSLSLLRIYTPGKRRAGAEQRIAFNLGLVFLKARPGAGHCLLCASPPLGAGRVQVEGHPAVLARFGSQGDIPDLDTGRKTSRGAGKNGQQHSGVPRYPLGIHRIKSKGSGEWSLVQVRDLGALQSKE
ncbi:unnamed protein product [Coccothraustes coccothraustes]